MSRLAERLARAEAKLAEGDAVTVITIHQLHYPVIIDGSPANRVAAIKAWYGKHGVPMTTEHANEVRAFEQPMKPTKPSTRSKKSTRRKGRSKPHGS